ncbi:hypothetical protein BDZ91DRAFT_349622 [Kalaharituber pfeilii]|nr:hypothetical protein BDZ91DRAFT_349622 [Kalaharituber pfeilii]
MERNWTGKKPDDNILLHYVGEEERRKRWIRFWESIEAKELRKRFNQAIKGECDSVLSPEGKAQGQAKPEPNSKAKSKKKKAVNEPSKEITTFTGPIPGPPPLGEFFRREALKLSGAFIPRKGVEPQKEFKRLAEAFRIKRNWTGKRADDDFSLRYVEGEELAKRWIRFWKSIEAKDLRKRFHQAVEEEFNWLLSRNKKVMKGMQAWEYLCELFGVGKAPLTRDQAEQVLRPVKVNIYDFIAAERDSLETGTMKLPHRFKNDRELGKYSKQENKIYPLEDAKEDGVLVLLLRRIRQYFDSF